jgi:phytoene synthase
MNVQEAYAEALRTTRREARNFAWGIMLLPRPKRQAVAALYAFARRVDDIADGQLSVEARRAGLERCRDALDTLPFAASGDAVLVALADAMIRYPIPKRALTDLVAGGLMDVERSRYATWEELREYCRCVAGAVGLACTAVYGPSDPVAAPRYAEAMGLALQQINIIRDVAEDWQLGRVYLPQDELEHFGISEDDIADARLGSGWRTLMEYQAARAEELLEEGSRLLPLLDTRSRLCVQAFAGIYHGLLVQMRERDFDVFSERPRLSAAEKLRAMVRGRAGPDADGVAAP